MPWEYQSIQRASEMSTSFSAWGRMVCTWYSSISAQHRCSERPLQTFLIDAVHHSDFQRPLSLADSASSVCPYIPNIRVLLFSPCPGPGSLLHGILPVGLCETGAMPWKSWAYCVKWKGIFIRSKIRFSLLTTLVKPETWDFILRVLLNYKVCWALWN